MNKENLNNNGFTLIEVVASIVLLTIVLVIFSSIFLQMDNINGKNGDNLDAANAGKELLVELKKKSYSEITSGSLPTSITNYSIEGSNPIIIKGNYIYLNRSFNFVISINDTIESGTQSLRRMKIEITNSSDSTLTTTHGWLEK